MCRATRGWRCPKHIPVTLFLPSQFLEILRQLWEECHQCPNSARLNSAQECEPCERCRVRGGILLRCTPMHDWAVAHAAMSRRYARHAMTSHTSTRTRTEILFPVWRTVQANLTQLAAPPTLPTHNDKDDPTVNPHVAQNKTCH